MGFRLLIADSRTMHHKGLRATLSQHLDMAFISESTNSTHLHQQLTSNDIDFVVAHRSLVTDFNLLPTNNFLLLISQPDKEELLAAYQRGMRGYLLDDPTEDLLQVALHLSPGKCLIDPALSSWLLQHLAHDPLDSLNLTLLTPREQEIFVLHTSGLPQADMANKLHIARSTVKRHLATISRKLQLKGRAK